MKAISPGALSVFFHLAFVGSIGATSAPLFSDSTEEEGFLLRGEESWRPEHQRSRREASKQSSSRPQLCGDCHCVPAWKETIKGRMKRKKCPEKAPLANYPDEVIEIFESQTMISFLGSQHQTPCKPDGLTLPLPQQLDSLPLCSTVLSSGGKGAVCGFLYDYTRLPKECLESEQPSKKNKSSKNKKLSKTKKSSKKRKRKRKRKYSSLFKGKKKYSDIFDIDKPCCPTSYHVETYENQEAALHEGASITHRGSCGQCSTSQDLAVYIKTAGGLTAAVSNCYFANLQDSTNLLSCLTNKIGFTTGCAIAWLINVIITGEYCKDECMEPGPPTSPFPDCELSDCLKCDQTNAGTYFLQSAGRTRSNSGLQTTIARPCEETVFIVQNPCPMPVEN